MPVLQLNEALEASRLEVTRLQAQREAYEETMKKAFMRGVCALNMEAMAMFHEQDNKGTRLFCCVISDSFTMGPMAMDVWVPDPGHRPQRSAFFHNIIVCVYTHPN